ncbi:HTTM domain-containing protein [Enhygromyxa salina]|uniref:Vitamin K-dependent gamma-carboxylase n=1 Tax=Enhygromyxa salina TaxID=215803 RepID=A0A2S9YR60_9BACT|nr:HTTM domain-containing protein [Enhygromyxa salina]PRQ07585.1 Vitamin K-dependent gamma-carboxylase [Enhygromyxa salina]
MPGAALIGWAAGRVAAADAWWRAGVPALRLAWVRALVGLYCLIMLLARVPSFTRLARFEPDRFEGVGVVSLLGAPLPFAAALATLALALLGSLAFSLGWRYRVTAPVFALALLWVTSYRNSWGHMSHSEHLVVVHVLVLSLVPAADALSLDARAQRTRERDPAHYGWPLRLLMLTVAISYMLAGYAKLSNGGWAWVNGDAIRNQIANDTLRKLRLGAFPSPLSPPLLRQPWLFGGLAVGTLAIELGAFMALVDSKLRAAWVVAAWVMHLGILAAMGIAFPYPISGIAFASFLPLERVHDRIQSRYGPLSGPG